MLAPFLELSKRKSQPPGARRKSKTTSITKDRSCRTESTASWRRAQSNHQNPLPNLLPRPSTSTTNLRLRTIRKITPARPLNTYKTLPANLNLSLIIPLLRTSSKMTSPLSKTMLPLVKPIPKLDHNLLLVRQASNCRLLLANSTFNHLSISCP